MRLDRVNEVVDGFRCGDLVAVRNTPLVGFVDDVHNAHGHMIDVRSDEVWWGSFPPEMLEMVMPRPSDWRPS